MNTNQIEVYRTYKELYPGALVLFHIKGHYVALMDDAEIIAKTLPQLASNISEGCVGIPDICYIQAILKLGDCGHVIKTIEHRNAQNELDFPDVEWLKLEKSEDY